jgi:hypothetical protein
MTWDLILSAAAVGISIWAIIKSYSVDRRQKKYLDIQISEHDQKEEDRKKANLYGEIRKTGLSSNKLIIENKGRASAINISIIFPENLDKKGIYIEAKNPIQISSLDPGQSSSLLVALDKGSSKEFRADFNWDDDYETGRTKKATIHIN